MMFPAEQSQSQSQPQSGDAPARNRLEREIRSRRNAILRALDKKEAHPNAKDASITKIRYNLHVLQGMVYAYLLVNDAYRHPAPITMTDDVNEMAMLWLSVDILRMRKRAYAKKPAKKPQDDNDSVLENGEGEGEGEGEGGGGEE